MVATAPRKAPPVGRLQQLSRDRAARDHARWTATSLEDCPRGEFYFDHDAADHVVRFFAKYLRHHKGEWAGKPFELESWQEHEVLRELFGWKCGHHAKCRDTCHTECRAGLRRFLEALIEIARKNGKSEMGGGIGLYMLVADGEFGAEVYSSATKRDQARIVFDAARMMVRQSPELKRFVTTLQRNIHCPRMSSKFEPLSAEGDTLDGLNPHCNIIDELHAHKNRLVYDVLVTAMGARRQPLNLKITTAGTFDPESIGWEQHHYGVQVLERVIEDENTFVFIAAADPDDDFTDPRTWAKANPNMGVSVKQASMRQLCEKARTTPGFLNTFKRLHLNMWTQQVDSWIPIEKWDACDQPVELYKLEGSSCRGGLDLASKIDITSLCLAFQSDPGIYDLLWRFWIPEATMQERIRKDRIPYDKWVDGGWVTPTPGEVTDYDFIREDIRQLARLYTIDEIAYDPWNAQQLANQLADDRFTMVEMRQGFASLSEPSKEFEKLVVSRKLRHGANPVARWMVSNVAKQEDPAGNIKPSKKHSRQKIDGVVAAIMALARATLGETKKRSVYETRGVVVLGED